MRQFIYFFRVCPSTQRTLGRLMRWANAKGANCRECLQISDLFSRGVDSVKTGEVLKIPEHMKNFPENHEDLGEYLLAVIRRSAAYSPGVFSLVDVR